MASIFKTVFDKQRNAVAKPKTTLDKLKQQKERQRRQKEKEEKDKAAREKQLFKTPTSTKTLNTGSQDRDDYDRYVSMMAPGNELNRLKTNISQLSAQNDRLSTRTQDSSISDKSKAALNKQLEDIRDKLKATQTRATYVSKNPDAARKPLDTSILPGGKGKTEDKSSTGRGGYSNLPYSSTSPLNQAQKDKQYNDMLRDYTTAAYADKLGLKSGDNGIFGPVHRALNAHKIDTNPDVMEAYRDTMGRIDKVGADIDTNIQREEYKAAYEQDLENRYKNQDYSAVRRAQQMKEYELRFTADPERYQQVSDELDALYNFATTHYAQGAKDALEGKEIFSLQRKVDDAKDNLNRATAYVNSFNVYVGDDMSDYYAAVEEEKRWRQELQIAEANLSEQKQRLENQAYYLGVDDQYGFSNMRQEEDYESVGADTSLDGQIVVGNYIYMDMNGMPQSMPITLADAQNLGFIDRAGQLTEDEKHDIRYLYANGGQDSVDAYINDYKGIELDKRAYEKTDEAAKERSENGNGWDYLGTLIGNAMNPNKYLSAVDYGMQWLGKALGDETPYNAWSELQRSAAATQKEFEYNAQLLQQKYGAWGELAAWAYSTAGSMVNNIAQIGITGGRGALTLMALDVFNSELQRTIEETNGDFDAAYKKASRAAAIEVLTEWLPLDNLLKLRDEGSVRNAINVLKNAGVETLEEGASGILTLLADGWEDGTLDQLEEMVANICVADPTLNNDEGQEKAWKKAWGQWALNLLGESASGFVSGGTMSAADVSVQSFLNALATAKQDKSTGSAIRKNGNLSVFVKAMNDIYGKNVASNERTSDRKLGKLLREAPENYEAYLRNAQNEDIAQAITRRYQDIKAAFEQTLGEQTTDPNAEPISSDQETIEDTPIQPSAPEAQGDQSGRRLEEMREQIAQNEGDYTEETTQDTTQQNPEAPAVQTKTATPEEALTALARGQALTPEQTAALRNDPQAWQAAQELNRARAGKGEPPAWLRNMDRTASNKATQTIADAEFAPEAPLEGTTEAAQQKAEERSKNLKTSPTGNTQVVDDDGRSQDAKVVRIESVADGDTDAQVVVDVGGEERTVPLSDIAFGNETKNGQQVMAYAADMPTPEIANAFRATVQPSQDMARVAAGMANAYNMGRQGYRNYSTVEGSVLTQGITSEQRRAAYDMGVRARQGNVQVQTEAAQNRQKNFAGNEWTGGRVDDSAVNPANFSDEQRRDVDLIRKIAAVSGANVVLFESQADATGSYMGSENGRYDRGSNTIYLDINAGRNSAGESMANTAMLRVMSHELTHFIERNSPETYSQLKSAVVDVLGTDSPVDIEDLIDRKLSADPSLNGDRDAALDEVVADACETMLRDSDAIDRLMETHPETARSFAEKVLDFLKRFRAAIVQAFGGERGARHTEAQVLLRNIDEAAARWSEGLSAAAEVAGRENAQTAQATVEAESTAESKLEQAGIAIDRDSGAAVQLSIRTAPQTETEISAVVDALVNSGLGFTREESEAWVRSLTSVSSVILQNMASLDYESDPRYSWMKKNSDYSQGSVDFNTNCPKRTQFTAIFDRLQKEMPNFVFNAENYEAIRQVLKSRGVTVTCGPCFVEDRRQHTGEIAQKFIDQLSNGELANKFKAKVGRDAYIPTQYDLATYDGLRALYYEHRGIHDAFVAFNNARGMASARLVEGMAEYDNQIKKWNQRTITSKNNKGGLRIFSLSDADPRTMIDIIQITLDAASKGLMIQGYTKKPWFARMIKDTGMRILRSHIPAGNGIYVAADGTQSIDYDDVEGINRYDPEYFDASGERNIGDNIIGINDDMIRLAMVTDDIDQIIPFHSSLANMIRNQKKIGDWHNYKNDQTDKDAATGKVASKQINIYRDVINAYEKAGRPIRNKVDFVNAFLEVCEKRNLTPRFARFLNTDADGRYVYTPGYEKFLVDYKLFDRATGEIIPQEPVKAIFDDEYNARILKDYVRGVNGIVPANEEDYQAVRRLFAADASTQHSVRDADYMSAVEEGDMLTAQRMVNDAAKAAGFATNDRGRLIKLYHGTKRFGFTVFNTDRGVPIFTSTNESVSTGYANFGRVRGTETRYTPDDGTTDWLIRTAKNVLNWDISPVTDEYAQARHDEALRVFKDLADRINDADFGEYVLPGEIETDFYNVIGFFQSLVDNDDILFGSEISAADKASWEDVVYGFDPRGTWEKLRAYYSEHRNEIAAAGSGPIWDVMFRGYDFGDALIDAVYSYRKLMDTSDKFVTGAGSVMARSEITEAIERTKGEGVYEGYGNLGSKPLEVDADGKYWLNVPCPEIGDGAYSTDYIVKWARDNGYTSVIIKNVMDPGINNAYGDDYVFFDSDQFKSSAPVTYDADGNVIPLSERFNTESPDIRYSRRRTRAEAVDDALLAGMMNQGRHDAADMRRQQEENDRLMRQQEREADRRLREAVDDAELAGMMHQGARDASILRHAQERAGEREARLRASAQSRLESQQERYERQISELRQRANDRIQRLRETYDKNKVRRQLTAKVKRLDAMIRKPTDQRHVPDELRGTVMEFIRPFLDRQGIFDKNHVAGVRRTYELLKENDSNAGYIYDEQIAFYLNALEHTLDGRRLGELLPNQMRMLNDIIGHLTKVVGEANQVFVNGRRQQVTELSDRFVSETENMAGKRESEASVMLDKLIRHGNMTAPWYFRRLGGVVGELGNDILKGETFYGTHLADYKSRFNEIQEKWDWKDWANKKKDTLAFTTESGDEIEMDREIALGLYATWQREHHPDSIAQTQHMEVGGVTFRQERNAIRPGVVSEHAVPISAKDFAQINNWLTDAQKGYADEMVELLTSLSEIGNEVSQRLYGYSKFGEGYYYPFQTNAMFRKTDLSKMENALIKNMSFTKALTAKANSPIFATNFTDTAAKHIIDMLTYCSFAEAQDNFLRVWDHHLDRNNTVSTRFREKYGTVSSDYITTFLKDIYGGPTMSVNEGTWNKLFSRFKKNAVLLNAAVAIQQPSAIMRSMYLVNPKYFVGAPKSGAFAEAMRYAGTATIKDVGGFDTNTSMGSVAWMTGRSNALDKINDAMAKPPEFMDKITWGAMWEAIKREQADLTGLNINSEELKQKAGQRFDEVMQLTQVYDSRIAKSQFMRDKGLFMKMATAFMAEPTLNFNLLMESASQFFQKNRKAGAGAASALIGSVILNSLLAGVIRAARDKKDEDATYLERYTRNVLEDINPTDWVPGMIPFVKDIVEIFKGYDVERTDMSIVSDAKSYYDTITDPNKSAWEKWKSGLNFVGLLTGMPLKNVIRDGEAALNTIDASKNELREGWLADVWRDADLGLLGDAVSKKDMYAAYAESLLGDDVDDQNAIRYNIDTFYESDEKKVIAGLTNALKDMYADGDISRNKLVELLQQHCGKEGGDAEKAVVEWDFKAATGENWSNAKLEELYENGTLTKEQAEDWLRKHGLEDEDKIWQKFQEWAYEGPQENYSQYNRLQDAVDYSRAYDTDDIKEITAAITEIYDHSKSDAGEISTMLKKYFKPLYVAASEAERERMEAWLIQVYAIAYDIAKAKGLSKKGNTKTDAQRRKSIRDWLND